MIDAKMMLSLAAGLALSLSAIALTGKTAVAADAETCLGCHEADELAGLSVEDITAALTDPDIKMHRRVKDLDAEEIQAIVGSFGADDPIHERHELMEEVGDAAKPIGSMFRGETEYDADVVMESLGVFEEVGSVFGDLFPEGTETGGGTEAAPAIWEDREGFEAALEEWRSAVDAAIEASPSTLDEARPVVGEVFNACKNCHDGYRIDED